MAKSGASKGAKKIKPFDEQNTNLAMGKSVGQKAKSDVLDSIKRLTREGKHTEAQALYNEQFKI
tara:strand:+ start:555 stop:746 length:192 start_codon:yes stop_codon:yes gene_type:complete